ncbi:MAG: hypothetical protein IKL40_06780 [Clostridia bacterium]|nr:hypothetical protein [Clostridia bacterium]
MINEKILGCFSPDIREIISKYPLINEIRMRKNSRLCFTVGNNNIITDHTVTEKEVQFSVNSFCKNSLHTYFDDIKKGFIPYDYGCRIGVCGKAVTEGGNVINISEITSLNVRLPAEKTYIPTELLKNLRIGNGLLVYSPPGYGKTTLLREIISFYSSPPYNKRIVVIDSRNELSFGNEEALSTVDVFSGYPKAIAIDIAVRTMSPEIVVCDEIGLNDDTNALVECKNCGVVLICSAHAKSITELLCRKNIKLMHNMHVFGGYLGINLKNRQRTYDYKKWEDIIL